MAKFRCKASGGIMEFHNEYDIEQIREQDDYEEIVEEEAPKRGRPTKKKEEE